MFGVTVEHGALYWHGSRKRQEVEITEELRALLELTVPHLRELLERRILPKPPNDERCPECSLIEACVPRVLGEQGKLRAALQDLFTLDEGREIA